MFLTFNAPQNMYSRSWHRAPKEGEEKSLSRGNTIIFNLGVNNIAAKTDKESTKLQFKLQIFAHKTRKFILANY